MILIRLAWRNLWRHPRRTILLGLAVAYATLVIVFFWGFTDGFIDSILVNQGRLLSAPVLITTPAYQEDPDPQHALPDLDFLATVRAHPSVRGVAVRLTFPVLVSSPYASMGTEARGVDPAAEPAVSLVPDRIVEGRMLEAPGEAVLGAGLAERLDVRLGERVVVDTASLAGPQAAGLVVVGLARTGLSSLDETLVWVHLDDARRLTGVTTGTEVALDVPRGQEESVAASLSGVLPSGIGAYGLRQRMGSLWADLRSGRAEVVVIGLFLSVFAALAVVSTVVVSVLQRTREFGVMMAVGMSPRQVSTMVVWETVLASALGWLAGLAGGFALTALMQRYNILGPILGQSYGALFAQLGVPEEVYTVTRPAYALYASSTVAMAVLFALLGPVRRVRALDPARALRSE